MVVGFFIGSAIGIIGGLTVGSFLFKDMRPPLSNVKTIDIAADADENVPDPIGPVRAQFYDMLRFAPHWTVFPDFDRVLWLNHLVRILWPHLNEAVQRVVREVAEPEIQKLVEGNGKLDGIVIEEFTLGETPMWVAGIKVYETRDDEVIMEVPVQWGSHMKMRVGVKVRLGPMAMYIPAEVSDLQLKALARMSISPLVDLLPCIGAVKVGLLQPPHLDLRLRLVNSWDVYAFPFVKPVVDALVRNVVQRVCLYPNQIEVPLMENGGVPLLPSGMLQLRLGRLDGVRDSHPYLVLYCKKNRRHWTDVQRPARGSVDFGGEEVRLLVENEGDQALTVELWNDDFGKDSRTGVAVVPLNCYDADFVAEPQVPKRLLLEFERPLRKGGRGGGRAPRSVVHHAAGGGGGAAATPPKAFGKLLLEVTYVPFFKPDPDDEEPDLTPELLDIKRLTQRMPSSLRSTPDVKGVLTVTVIRCQHLPLVDSMMSAYVEVQLVDPEREPGRDVRTQKTAVVQNDTSPRWGAKMEFVMVSATSSLTFTVLDKPGTFENLLSVGRAEDKPVGRLRMMVSDVVKNQRLKDTWPLQEAQQGDIELKIEWQTLLLI